MDLYDLWMGNPYSYQGPHAPGRGEIESAFAPFGSDEITVNHKVSGRADIRVEADDSRVQTLVAETVNDGILQVVTSLTNVTPNTAVTHNRRTR